jgi:hypothetical protein
MFSGSMKTGRCSTTWVDRVTTAFPRQEHYATDPEILAKYPHGYVQLGHIGDLVKHDLFYLVKR